MCYSLPCCTLECDGRREEVCGGETEFFYFDFNAIWILALHARMSGNLAEELDFRLPVASGLCFDHEMECDCLAVHS